MRRSLPLVLRDSRSRWAWAASAEGVDVVGAEFEGAVGDPAEDVFGTGFEVGAGWDVVRQLGAGDVEGAHGGELMRSKGGTAPLEPP